MAGAGKLRWLHPTATSGESAPNSRASAAGSFIDAQQRGSVGGGSIDFGVRVCAIILLVGIALFAVGAYIADNFREATAMTGLLVVIVSGFLLLIGGGGRVGGCRSNLPDRGLHDAVWQVRAPANRRTDASRRRRSIGNEEEPPSSPVLHRD